MTVSLSLLAEPGLTLTSLSGKPELVRGEERSENGAWGKAEQGQGWAVVPGARAALLSPLSSAPPLSSADKPQNCPQGKGGSAGSQPEERRERSPSRANPALGWGWKALGKIWGLIPSPKSLPQPPHSLPPRCHSHGHSEGCRTPEPWIRDEPLL